LWTRRKWAIVDMKTDWKVIYLFELRESPGNERQ